MIDILFPKLHKEGYRFLAIAAVITFILLLISNFLGIVSFIITIWVYYFFRDPERFPINDENYLVSPADGVVSQVIETNGPKELGLETKKYTRVSIFMNVFNCHVNRIPSSGKINQIIYKPGSYIKASLDNGGNAVLTIEHPVTGREITSKIRKVNFDKVINGAKRGRNEITVENEEGKEFYLVKV